MMLKQIECITYDFPHADLFIDVGGNEGMWTAELIGLHDKVIFIEPSENAISIAKERIAGHCEFFGNPELKDRVHYYKNLCSDVAGERKNIFSPTPETGNFSVFGKEIYGTDNIKLEENDIETITLDGFLPEIKDGAKIVLKIDTEGCDLDVLIGGTELIKKFKPLIFCEMHWHLYYDDEKKNKVFALLQSLGYTISTMLWACYVDEPDTIFDLVHTGKEMKDLHFFLTMQPLV